MASRPSITKKNGQKLTHDGRAAFDPTPLLRFVQNLVEISALREDRDILELLDPAPAATFVTHATRVADVCRECAEMGDAFACIDLALADAPDDIAALKVKSRIHSDCDERAEARKLLARVKDLETKGGGGKAKAKPTKPASALSEDDVALAYEVLEGEFLYGSWKNVPSLAKAFVKWAKKAHPDLAEDQPKAVLLEGLIEDEEGGGAMADFVNGLPLELRAQAIAGMHADLTRALDGKKPKKPVRELLERLRLASG